MKAVLALEDGTIFEGRTFAGQGEALAEVCFNTSMTGYQEVLTDPSYKLQMVTMTYPLIGNYGVCPEDMESGKIQVEAFLVKEYQEYFSNWRGRSSLADFLNEHGVLGVEGLATRRLSRRLRIQGAMKGLISTKGEDPQVMVQRAREWPGLDGIDCVPLVTCGQAYRWEGGPAGEVDLRGGGSVWRKRTEFKVAVFDFGIKYNILRHLERIGAEVVVLPAGTGAEEVLQLEPDGVFLSNGPGDPILATYAVETIKNLVGEKPIFGICLGQQLLGLALGGSTYKLKFGHRGGNQPVKDLTTGKVEITAQNHGYCVDLDTLDPDKVELTHINLNDNTLEGFRHRELPLFCVQYHPENSPGPHDATYLFNRFAELMARER